MTLSLSAALSALILPFSLQATVLPPSKPTSFADLQIEEATAPRCGIAFAIVQGWQEGGDARGGAWPNMKEAGAREFFLRSMVRVIDTYSLERSDVNRLVEGEMRRHRSEDFASVQAMMPGCLVFLDSASLNGG